MDGDLLHIILYEGYLRSTGLCLKQVQKCVFLSNIKFFNASQSFFLFVTLVKKFLLFNLFLRMDISLCILVSVFFFFVFINIFRFVVYFFLGSHTFHILFYFFPHFFFYAFFQNTKQFFKWITLLKYDMSVFEH